MYVFGELLRGFRERIGYSQKELAHKIGVNRNTMSNWERSQFLPDTRELTLRLADELQLSAQETDQLLRAADYPLEDGGAIDSGKAGTERQHQNTKSAASVYGYLHLTHGAARDIWYELRGERLLIGWNPEKCDLVIPSECEHVSRVHATVYQARNEVYIEDSSTYGTFVDGKRVVGATKLRPGQNVLLGGESPSTGVCVLEFSREPYSTR